MNKFLLKKGPLLVFAVLSILLFLGWGIYKVCAGSYLYGVYTVIYVALIVSILVSYKRCATNCQKALIGILLMFILRDELDVAYFAFCNPDIFSASTRILMVLIVVLFSIFLINYVLMLSDHVGDKYLSWINNVALVLLFVVYVVLVKISVGGHITDAVLLKAAELMVVMMISCINMRVQSYKRIRAAARANGTWNEDTRKEAKKLFVF